LIGEIYLPVDRLVTYYGENLMGAHQHMSPGFRSRPTMRHAMSWR
jgi:hypothetical protein